MGRVVWRAAAGWSASETMTPNMAIAISAAILLAVNPGRAGERRSPNGIELLVRADDMGVAEAVNEACVASYKHGIARSVEVIANGAWFPDAVRLLTENPGLD